MGDYSKSTELFNSSSELLQKIVSEYPNEPDLRHVLAHIHWQAGLTEFGTDHNEEARKLFESAISLWSSLVDKGKSAEHAYRVAWSLLRCPENTLRNVSKALLCAQASVELAPNNRDYQNILANALLNNGDHNKALQTLETIKVQNQSWNANDYCVLARLQELNGDHSQALESLDQARNWTASNRPANLDDLRFIAEVEKDLSKH